MHCKFIYTWSDYMSRVVVRIFKLSTAEHWLRAQAEQLSRSVHTCTNRPFRRIGTSRDLRCGKAITPLDRIRERSATPPPQWLREGHKSRRVPSDLALCRMRAETRCVVKGGAGQTMFASGLWYRRLPVWPSEVEADEPGGRMRPYLESRRRRCAPPLPPYTRLACGPCGRLCVVYEARSKFAVARNEPVA